MNEPWYESDDPDRVAHHAIPRVWGWVVATVMVILLVAAGVWAFRTAAAPAKGQGDAYQQQQSGANRVAAQERFHQQIEDIRATDAKLDGLASAAKADPADKTAAQTLTGTRNYCLSVVAEYNAAARQYNSKDFRDADLPERIDLTDPTTDCQESNR